MMNPCLPCPFCGHMPAINKRAKQAGCQTMYCPAENSWVSFAAWNTRYDPSKKHTFKITMPGSDKAREV